MTCYCYEKYKDFIKPDQKYHCFTEQCSNWRQHNMLGGDNMLHFKNDKGEIVMTEKDNGKLDIHDSRLKESLEGEKRLEEVNQKDEK